MPTLTKFRTNFISYLKIFLIPKNMPTLTKFRNNFSYNKTSIYFKS